MFNGEKLSGASHTRLNLVVDEQRAMLAAQFLSGQQITGVGNVHAFALNGLDDKGSDIAFL